MTAYDRTALLHLARAWAIDNSDETWVYMPAATCPRYGDEDKIFVHGLIAAIAGCYFIFWVKTPCRYTHLQQLTACIISELTYFAFALPSLPMNPPCRGVAKREAQAGELYGP